MKNCFLVVMMIVGVSLPSLADSTAKKERGGSCTDHCTMTGKQAITRLYDQMGRANQGAFRNLCSKADGHLPGNIHWCEKNCLGAGGLWTRFMNADRKKNVEEFIESSKNACAQMPKWIIIPK